MYVYVNVYGMHNKFVYRLIDTAHSVENETRNDRRNANRNPEWWADFSQLSKSKNSNSSVSRGTNSNRYFD